MKMTRRDFLKWMVASGVALGMGKMDIAKAEEIINTATSTPVIWLQAAGCSGCTLSFLDMVENETYDDTIKVYNSEDVLMNKIDLKYHSTLMAAAASECMEVLNSEYSNSGYILVVEGGIPTGESGNYCIVGERDGKPLTAMQALQDFAANASTIISAGNCSAYRGVAGAGNNLTSVKAVDEILDSSYASKIINLPGCPVHPFIIGATIAKLLAGETIALDEKKRPIEYYTSKLHAANCPLKEQHVYAVNGVRSSLAFAKTIGTCGQCMASVGCRGTEAETKVTCYTKLWGRDWTNKKGCFGAGSPCIGCSNPNFPFTTYASDGSATSSSISKFAATPMKL